MSKDFHRRLQRDLKKIVDARILASEARHGGVKVLLLHTLVEKLLRVNSRYSSISEFLIICDAH